MSDHAAAKVVIRGQLLQLGLGGQVVGRRATNSVNAAASRAGRGVHAVGIGRKITAGQETDELAVRIYVVQKLPESLLAPRDRLPRTLDGVATDVIECEPAFAFAKRSRKKRTSPNRNRRTESSSSDSPAMAPNGAAADRRAAVRPILGGVSGGHRDITAGTIGCVCRSRRAGDDSSAAYLLSNNHVFADLNRAHIGDPLYQPSPADGADFNHHVASLHRFVVLRLGGMIPNRADAAIGKLMPSIPYELKIHGIGPTTGVAHATRGMLIRKFGRSTGYREGRIDDGDYDALIGMDADDTTVVALFEDQLRIVPEHNEPIGLGGDSGSMVLDRNRPEIIGLFFAGPPSGTYGIANRIEHVLTELEIEIP